MIICEVKHSNDKYAKDFVFKSEYSIPQGMWVMCDTAKGDQPGIVSECFEVDEASPLYKRYLKLMGAYEPLKEVIGVFIPLSILKRIAKSQIKK